MIGEAVGIWFNWLVGDGIEIDWMDDEAVRITVGWLVREASWIGVDWQVGEAIAVKTFY